MTIKKLGWTCLAVALTLGSLGTVSAEDGVTTCLDPVCYEECRLEGWNHAYCSKLCYIPFGC